MASTLQSHLKTAFNSSSVSDLARTLNENPAATQKAVDGLLPAITGGVSNQASQEGGAIKLYQLLKSTPFDREANLGELVDTNAERQKAAGSGNALLKQLYGERAHRLAEATAQYSSIGRYANRLGHVTPDGLFA